LKFSGLAQSQLAKTARDPKQAWQVSARDETAAFSNLRKQQLQHHKPLDRTPANAGRLLPISLVIRTGAAAQQ
jgi:hypothetical protein